MRPRSGWGERDFETCAFGRIEALSAQTFECWSIVFGIPFFFRIRPRKLLQQVLCHPVGIAERHSKKTVKRLLRTGVKPDCAAAHARGAARPKSFWHTRISLKSPGANADNTSKPALSGCSGEFLAKCSGRVATQGSSPKAPRGGLHSICPGMGQILSEASAFKTSWPASCHFLRQGWLLIYACPENLSSWALQSSLCAAAPLAAPWLYSFSLFRSVRMLISSSFAA